MKTILTILALALPMKAAVVLNDAVIYAPGANWFTPMFVSQASDFLRVSVTTDGDNFTVTKFGIAEPYALFRITAGVGFGAAYVNSHTAFVNNWNTPGSGVLTLAPGQSQLLGYWDGSWSYTAVDSDLFGWARVENVGGVLTVTNSAASTNSGLFAGTATVIPEPSSAALFAAAVIGLAARRARNGK